MAIDAAERYAKALLEAGYLLGNNGGLHVATVTGEWLDFQILSPRHDELPGKRASWESRIKHAINVQCVRDIGG